MELRSIQRSAHELSFGKGEDELRVLFSMSMPVGVLYRGSYAVLKAEERKFRTTNLHLGHWLKRKTIETARDISLLDLVEMIGRLMVKAIGSSKAASGSVTVSVPTSVTSTPQNFSPPVQDTISTVPVPSASNLPFSTAS